ncbi:M20 family metallo-hydrolase [Ornithinimicrobium sediminis]|uniref:M20 family metallo-hydrolase n=1 Tax=Ornithinimicrobium sediminis TaxID=2904603 RepID=UPI001E38CE31|nr:M20 family metallo-hydrolase [Ornithinimicrobium sediminis]MCE0485463.1 M20 family metallo-hydrolase [Ornithinimicrobium sediminis]
MSKAAALNVSIERIQRDIEHLATLGQTPSGGVSRTSFSSADKQMRQWLHGQCQEHGLTMRTDGIGNIFIRAEGMNVPKAAPVCAGSHLDSVPEGGRYDGIVGSVAALEVLRVLGQAAPALQRPVEVVIFADEEGNYHHLLGSTALVDNFTWEELQQLRGREGDLLVDALSAMDWDPRHATRTALSSHDVHAFVELHIEQGPVLEESHTDIGIVTSIVGLAGGQLDFVGSQDHAGTTPMRLRRDPMQAAGSFLGQLARIASGTSSTAVLTCGLMEIEPGGTNVVPRLARLHLDFRDPDPDVLSQLEQRIIDCASNAANQYGVEASFRRMSVTAPVPLDPHIRALLREVALGRNLSVTDIPSGAGHDAQNMARLTPTAMIFIPSAGGKSHSPQEHSSWQDIEHGANVLLDGVVRLAQA